MTTFIDPEAVVRASMASCLGYRRRAREYRRWAKEAEEAGDLEAYRKWKAEADRAERLKWSAFSTAVAYHG